MVDIPNGLVIRPRRRRFPTKKPVQIVSIGIKNLFGKLNYPEITIKKESGAGRIAVLYGDNGTGKTTILRLIYACLSWQSHAGLRTRIASTPFNEFLINFSDGSYVKVIKHNLKGNYIFEISTPNTQEQYQVVVSKDGKVREQDSVTRLEHGLKSLNLEILFVDHNRIVQSTFSFVANYHPIFEMPDFIEKNDLADYINIDGNYIHGLQRKEADLQFPLHQVVDALNQKFRTEAYQQGAAGEHSAATVYLEIAKSIVRDRRRKETDTPIADIESLLKDLKQMSLSYVRHGLLSAYPFDEFASIYLSAPKARKASIEAVLTPFLDSIQRRISALESIHSVITLFESELSKYMNNKKVSYKIPQGLIIADDNGPIELEELSSGEKQLVFLLCSAVIARSKRSIIIIDEPELSLNYKWQRLIAGSLANLSVGGDTQYILASHSIEIISRYVDSSFELAA